MGCSVGLGSFFLAGRAQEWGFYEEFSDPVGFGGGGGGAFGGAFAGFSGAVSAHEADNQTPEYILEESLASQVLMMAVVLSFVLVSSSNINRRLLLLFGRLLLRRAGGREARPARKPCHPSPRPPSHHPGRARSARPPGRER